VIAFVRPGVAEVGLRRRDGVRSGFQPKPVRWKSLAGRRVWLQNTTLYLLFRGVIMASQAAKRPVYRNIHVTQILGYRLPIAGIVSILHRISGALLFLAGLPLILWLFQESLISELGFERFRTAVAHPVVKVALLGLLWAFCHHFVAGIRYLLLDNHVGLEKGSAANSAKAVIAISLALTLLVAGSLFGLY
jgi:succinate dehydrogenase / fumarate reductase cytochrome b subunit